MENDTIERFGSVIKEEPLTCIQDDILFPSICMLESDSPYFGYYSQEPQTEKPRHLYCVLDGHYSFETITRATQNAKKKYKENFNAASGTITIGGKTCQVIRIKELQQYNQFGILQRLYLDEGITFKTKSIKAEGSMTMIRIQKFFRLEKLSENIYSDLNETNHVYFAIPHQLDWDYFKELTKQVKLDTCNFYFDAALAFMYNECNIVDMIRIYRKKYEPNDIETLKDKYCKWIAEGASY